MQITISNIVPASPMSVNAVYHMSWKINGEPDSAYRTLPDATTNPAGLIIAPTPYVFDTEGTETQDIDVRAIAACDASYVLVQTVPGLEFCCPAGYVLAPDGITCNFTETTPPIITEVGVCVACSQLTPEYGINGTKFWATKNYNADLSDSNFTLLTSAYWNGDPAGSGTASVASCTSRVSPAPVVGTPPSPVNRQGVWVDTNCDGSKDPLASGNTLSFTWLINSPQPNTVFVGIAGDNNFTLSLNGTQIVSKSTGTDPFTNLYLFPIDLVSGSNFIGASFVGDGSVNDMGCMIIIDNDAASIPGITNDAQIQYLFQTSQLIGAEPIDIASCPAGYTLDTSGGSGNYICVRITTVRGTVCPAA